MTAKTRNDIATLLADFATQTPYPRRAVQMPYALPYPRRVRRTPTIVDGRPR